MEETGMGKRFDIILSNPPYSKGLHMKFLDKYIQIIDKNNGKIITIQPANKAFTDLHKAKLFKNKIESNNVNISDVEFNTFAKEFNIGIRDVMMILTIDQFLSLEGYDTDIRKARRKTGIASNEFFTPYSIVKKMCDKVDPEVWSDPTKTWLEPCMGNFQFVIFILYRRIHEYDIPWQVALETCFGVELMEDNIQEGRQRVHELLRNIAPEYDPKIADKIMDHNFVCSDFFKWDFENWRPMTEEEIKSSKKK